MNLQKLAQMYNSERFILSGIDNEAEENNKLVINAIKQAGEKINDRYNDIFAIQLGGSRIKGYNTKDSDIDIVFVSPDTVKSHDFIYEVLKETFQNKGIENRFDRGIGMWSEYEIKTDASEFIYTIDYSGHEFATLFGCTLYQNPNLLLTKLTALEVIRRYPDINYIWDRVLDKFENTYLGERGYLVSKISERYKISQNEVSKIFSEELFYERYIELKLEDPIAMYEKLLLWYVKNKRKLKSYVMKNIYEEVKEVLESGF